MDKTEPKKRKKGATLKPTDPLYKTILIELQNPSMTPYRIAQKHGIAQTIVSRIAFQNGMRKDDPLPSEIDNPIAFSFRKRITYGKERRVQLLDDAFIKAEQMLQEAGDPKELESVVNTVAKLIDKRRLEDGEATSRSESTKTDARDSLTNKLDELAIRRAQRSARGLDEPPENVEVVQESK